MFQHIAWAMKAPTPDALSRWLLVVLADHANAEHICWPSIATLAQRTGMGTSTVCRKLTLLEESGLITRKSGCEGRSTRYLLNAEGVPEWDNPIPERETKLPVNNNTLSDEWKPSEELIVSINETASKHGVEINHDLETIKFVSHHQQTGRKLKRIDLAYRKWCANTISFASGKGSGKTSGPRANRSNKNDHARRWREFIGSAGT